METESTYFAKRFEQEMDAGDHASCQQVRAVHYEMATRYALKAARISAAYPQRETAKVMWSTS